MMHADIIIRLNVVMELCKLMQDAIKQTQSISGLDAITKVVNPETVDKNIQTSLQLLSKLQTKPKTYEQIGKESGVLLQQTEQLLINLNQELISAVKNKALELRSKHQSIATEVAVSEASLPMFYQKLGKELLKPMRLLKQKMESASFLTMSQIQIKIGEMGNVIRLAKSNTQDEQSVNEMLNAVKKEQIEFLTKEFNTPLELIKRSEELLKKPSVQFVVEKKSVLKKIERCQGEERYSLEREFGEKAKQILQKKIDDLNFGPIEHLQETYHATLRSDKNDQVSNHKELVQNLTQKQQEYLSEFFSQLFEIHESNYNSTEPYRKANELLLQLPEKVRLNLVAYYDKSSVNFDAIKRMIASIKLLAANQKLKLAADKKEPKKKNSLSITMAQLKFYVLTTRGKYEDYERSITITPLYDSKFAFTKDEQSFGYKFIEHMAETMRSYMLDVDSLKSVNYFLTSIAPQMSVQDKLIIRLAHQIQIYCSTIESLNSVLLNMKQQGDLPTIINLREQLWNKRHPCERSLSQYEILMAKKAAIKYFLKKSYQNNEFNDFLKMFADIFSPGNYREIHDFFTVKLISNNNIVKNTLIEFFVNEIEDFLSHEKIKDPNRHLVNLINLILVDKFEPKDILLNKKITIEDYFYQLVAVLTRSMSCDNKVKQKVIQQCLLEKLVIILPEILDIAQKKAQGNEHLLPEQLKDIRVNLDKLISAVNFPHVEKKLLESVKQSIIDFSTPELRSLHQLAKKLVKVFPLIKSPRFSFGFSTGSGLALEIQHEVAKLFELSSKPETDQVQLVKMSQDIFNSLINKKSQISFESSKGKKDNVALLEPINNALELLKGNSLVVKASNTQPQTKTFKSN